MLHIARECVGAFLEFWPPVDAPIVLEFPCNSTRNADDFALNRRDGSTGLWPFSEPLLSGTFKAFCLGMFQQHLEYRPRSVRAFKNEFVEIFVSGLN